MSDLTATEQTNVRAALAFLRARCGGWETAAKALGFTEGTLRNVLGRHNTATPRLALKLARLARVGVDDVLEGRFPPSGACPHCGHVKAEAAE